MLESQRVGTTSAPVRLRSTARSRTMPARGVAVSAGGDAVIINGGSAETIWSVMEPLLMAGCDPEELIGRFPTQGRPLIRSIMEQLDEHDLLREVETHESIPADNSSLEEYFEQLTRRPRAAAARMARTAIGITGTCAVLNEAVRLAFTEVGFATVTTTHIPATDDGVNTVLVHRSPLDAEGARPAAAEGVLTVLAVSGGGWHAAGPTNAQPFPQDVEAVHRWVRTKVPMRDRTDPEPDIGGIYAFNLVAAQLALAALNAVAREIEAVEMSAQPPLEPAQVLAARPQFMVTSPSLVSEPHPVTTLTPLNPSNGEVWHPTQVGTPESTDDSVLDALEPLWAGLFSRFAGPTPGSHEQLPLGMAEAGTVDAGVPGRLVAGTGLTTAEARLDALSVAATDLALNDFSPIDGGFAQDTLTVSWSREAAAADATVGMLDRHAQWHPVGTPEELFSPRTRRMWAALVLRYHRTLRMETAALANDQTLHRCRVSVDGRWTATGIAVTPEAAAEEALLRAAGITQFSVNSVEASGSETAPPRSLAPMLASSRTGILAWAKRNPQLIGYRIPSGAEYWSRVGLYPVVTAWL